MAKYQRVSIMGCGWLGLPLAETLLAAGYAVKGSTTTPAKLGLLAQKGIEPFFLNLAHESNATDLTPFLAAEYLIIAFPPGLRAGNGAKYLEQLAILTQSLETAPVLNILFISSTSVYPDLNREVNESEDLQPYLFENILLQAEALVSGIPDKTTTIVRMSGLVGGTRHPGRFLAGKRNIPNPAAPVNLIHQDDCVNLISEIIAKQDWGNIYNACADEHPSREIFYTAAARKLNLPLPHFAPPDYDDKYKIISNQKIKTALAYEFMHPDPMLFF